MAILITDVICVMLGVLFFAASAWLVKRTARS